MSCLSWNCRGAGDPRTVRELEALVKANSPKIIFLAETRQRGARLGHLRWRLGLKNFVAVDSVGKSGGLDVFWHESVDVTLKRYSQRIMDLEVKLFQEAPTWRLTFVYGEPRVKDRKHMWELLMRLKNFLIYLGW